MNSQFILIMFSLLNMISALLIIFGLVLYFAGYKLIRIIDTIVGFSTGSFLGYFIGVVFFLSETMGLLLGGILGISFAFFSFVYYRYLKGLLLGFLAFIWVFYASFSTISLDLSLTLIVSAIACVCVVAVAYKYEKISTMLLTSLVGSIMLLHSFFGLSMEPLAILVSILLGICGLLIQLKVVDKKFPGII